MSIVSILLIIFSVYILILFTETYNDTASQDINSVLSQCVVETESGHIKDTDDVLEAIEVCLYEWPVEADELAHAVQCAEVMEHVTVYYTAPGK